MKKTKLRGLLSPFLKKIRLKKIVKFIGKNKTILDIGCDDASLLEFIRSVKHYTGIDLNHKVIEQNKKRFGKFKNIDFFKINFNEKINLNKKYDIIVLSAVIEHIDDFGEFLSNIKNLIHKESLLLITTPTKKSDIILKFGASFCIFSKESLDEHQKYFSYKDFVGLKDWKLKLYKKFEFGLNQLLILERK
jgi:2-polyprenyl-3-methyl-5-hydroxy-6-metoxy-1,4-benzoquinol methylase